MLTFYIIGFVLALAFSIWVISDRTTIKDLGYWVIAILVSLLSWIAISWVIYTVVDDYIKAYKTVKERS